MRRQDCCQVRQVCIPPPKILVRTCPVRRRVDSCGNICNVRSSRPRLNPCCYATVPQGTTTYLNLGALGVTQGAQCLDPCRLGVPPCEVAKCRTPCPNPCICKVTECSTRCQESCCEDVTKCATTCVDPCCQEVTKCVDPCCQEVTKCATTCVDPCCQEVTKCTTRCVDPCCQEVTKCTTKCVDPCCQEVTKCTT
ncbi:PREDICTED: keratin-associated protein 9-1-like, partial [Chaetura pelagica]|uniref:keratin-associated protein 9-1-like n=1 Tax=Chaetura pelagica TaxID=8897 RepID=UPI000523D4E8